MHALGMTQLWHHMQIMQQLEAALFSAPVSDADAPGYSKVVSRPMDLGTVKSRLQRKQYQHPADVYADIRQVISSTPNLVQNQLQVFCIAAWLYARGRCLRPIDIGDQYNYKAYAKAGCWRGSTPALYQILGHAAQCGWRDTASALRD